jgi:hypothetical protein
VMSTIDLGQLAVLEDLHVVGAQIAHRLAALIGQRQCSCGWRCRKD